MFRGKGVGKRASGVRDTRRPQKQGGGGPPARVRGPGLGAHRPHGPRPGNPRLLPLLNLAAAMLQGEPPTSVRPTRRVIRRRGPGRPAGCAPYLRPLRLPAVVRSETRAAGSLRLRRRTASSGPLPLGQHAAGSGEAEGARGPARESAQRRACASPRGPAGPGETIAAAAGERGEAISRRPRALHRGGGSAGRGQGGQPQAAAPARSARSAEEGGPRARPPAPPARLPASPAFALGEGKARRRVVLRKPRGRDLHSPLA